ncbi:DUF1801 domain-containing protein [Taibaiella sp. KBW10]|uniref:DUF1801 domain-containing protein n=1 Tax=Taibaiella sp. KBW10 TaxID=2153357 RepID=UPI000F59D24C|nr:DUF1801 domain-containing protein [Taibaiella sp. KBW10]RQO30782.1 DUF1801 domain-containing protein [Taibaiella sp. KBW10]
MAKPNKTVTTDASVSDFIDAIPDAQKREDSYALIALMEAYSGHKAKMWGSSIIGFGHYHYQYASGHEGDAALLGFSPRKAAISLYISCDMEQHKPLLEQLGKYKMAKACIYIKKLSDIDESVLRQLCQDNIAYLKKTYQVS